MAHPWIPARSSGIDQPAFYTPCATCGRRPNETEEHVDVCSACATKSTDSRSRSGHLVYDPKHGTTLESHRTS